MKKHAYLLMVHNHEKQVEVLLSLLDNRNNDIYVHIDKKSKDITEDQLRKCINKSNIYFVNSMDVQWAGYSMIECELSLMENALKKEYSYLHLLSGADLPVKSQKQIHDFFEKNAGKEFIQFNSEKVSEEYKNRKRYYYFFQEKCGRNQNIWFYLDKVSIKLQKLLKIDRLKKTDFEVQKGTNWFSITSDFAQYVCEQKEFIKKYFSFSRSGEEMFLQTICVNSPYKEKLFDQNYDNNHYACLRKIDWKRGTPYVFQMDDFEELIQAPHMFARKFDENRDNEIIMKLQKYIERD